MSMAGKTLAHYQITSQYSMVLPDKITIYRMPIDQVCRTPERIIRQVQQTVKHELAHHFGIDDDRLRELGTYCLRRDVNQTRKSDLSIEKSLFREDRDFSFATQTSA